MLFHNILPVFSILTLVTAAPPLEAALEKRQSIPTCNNGGEALCCQGTFAGDLPLIVALAGLSSFPLNPNDINCLGSK
jgi:hypothetical protein